MGGPFDNRDIGAARVFTRRGGVGPSRIARGKPSCARRAWSHARRWLATELPTGPSAPPLDKYSPVTAWYLPRLKQIGEADMMAAVSDAPWRPWPRMRV